MLVGLNSSRKNMNVLPKHFSQLIKEVPPVEFRRQALLQIALVANKQGYYDREFQIYSQYLSRFPDDHNCALVNLRMGQLLRDQMGAMDQAIEQFHTVISSRPKRAISKMIISC